MSDDSTFRKFIAHWPHPATYTNQVLPCLAASILTAAGTPPIFDASALHILSHCETLDRAVGSYLEILSELAGPHAAMCYVHNTASLASVIRADGRGLSHNHCVVVSGGGRESAA